MQAIALIDPPQSDLIEKILRHYGLAPLGEPPAEDGSVHGPDGDSDGIFRRAPGTAYVDIDTFLAIF